MVAMMVAWKVLLMVAALVGKMDRKRELRWVVVSVDLMELRLAKT